MAAEIQSRRPPELERSTLWEGRFRFLFNAPADLPWNLGDSSIPVYLRARGRAALSHSANARVVFSAWSFRTFSRLRFSLAASSGNAAGFFTCFHILVNPSRVVRAKKGN